MRFFLASVGISLCIFGAALATGRFTDKALAALLLGIPFISTFVGQIVSSRVSLRYLFLFFVVMSLQAGLLVALTQNARHGFKILLAMGILMVFSGFTVVRWNEKEQNIK